MINLMQALSDLYAYNYDDQNYGNDTIHAIDDFAMEDI